MTHLEQASINAISTLTPPRSIVSRDETGEAASRVGRTQLLRLVAPTGDQKGLKTSFRSAVRSQTSLLAPVERVCLTWLAQRMPAWVMPDHLTLLGLAAMLMAGVCYALAGWWPPFLLIANIWLAVNWFGDSLDGTLARFRDKQRPRYGFYVDHIADAFGTLFIMCGLAMSGYMSWVVALAALVAYSLMSINVYLATYTIGTFRLSFYKFSPTELRILLAAGNTVALYHPTTRLLGGTHLFYDVAAVIATALVVMITIASVARNTLTLYRAEKV
ncbi:MAG TPA: CDP-alcohol phosphatidyltransferase family protein [Blastocatellia bacterium]|nr:CDP-alcohol phosphatidyltransferase family protein [Blastocatellia bacterium]